jgi:TM2 domain-containing membrane protein YozV
MKVKLHLNWKKIVLFLLVSAGLIYLTRSLLMSIGIVMILFVIDALIVNYEYRQQTKRIFDDLRREHESKEE